MTTVRKSLHPLQPVAGDKENLVGPGRMIHADKDNLKSLRETNENEKISTPQESKVPSNKRKKVACKSIQVGSAKPVITADDLTSTDGPSENYWELLAEQRRWALEEALEENERLHNKVERLEEEIKICKEENKICKEESNMCKELLKEHESLIDVLKEMINDPAEDSVNINDSIDG